MKSIKITQQITRRETESIAKYLQDVSKLSKEDNLTIEEELELARKIQLGDKKAENELIERNLRFVISVAKQYQNQGCSLEDLIGEGNCGLIKAAKKYDAERNVKFISYAVWWIRQSILSFLNENINAIRLPLNKVSQISKIKKVREKFEQVHNRKPTTYEISEELNFEISEEDLNRIFLIDQNIQSLNVVMSNKSNSSSETFTLEDSLSNSDELGTDEHLDNEDLKQIIKRMLHQIPSKQKTVIELYYGLTGKEPKTLDEISEYLGLTRERIRQVKNDAMENLCNQTNFLLSQPYFK